MTDDLSLIGFSGPGEWDMNNGNFEMYQGIGTSRQGLFRGTYKTAGGDTLVSTYTGINGFFLNEMIADEMGGEGPTPDFGFENRFYTFTELETTIKNYIRQGFAGSGMSGAELDVAVNAAWEDGFKDFADMMEPQTAGYSLNAAKTRLTISMGPGGELVLTKKNTGGTPGGSASLTGNWKLDTSGMEISEEETYGIVGALNLKSDKSFEASAIDTTTNNTVPMMKGTYSISASGNQFTATPTDVHGSFINASFEMMLAGMFNDMFGGEGDMSEAELEEILVGLEAIKGQLLFQNQYYKKAALETEVKTRMKTVFQIIAQQEGQNPSSSEIDAMVDKTYTDEVAPVLEGVFKQQPPTTYEVTDTVLVFYTELGEGSGGEPTEVVFVRQ